MSDAKTLQKLDHALQLAELGFRVFPLTPGRKTPPKDFPWKEEATRDTARIKEWWGADPNLNIGVAMGQGTIVVDADTKKDKPGLASLETLDLLGLPQSFRVKTPSGGMHVYLRVEKQHHNRVDSIPDYPGIDIRSDDGYVLGPGSVIDGKTYEAIPGEIEPAGDWLEDILLKNAPSHTIAKTKDPVVELDLPEHVNLAVEYLTQRAPEAVEGAGGNETTYRVAAQCRDFGLSPETTFELMLEHWNEAKAFPAWLPADLQTVVGNAYKYATGEWGGRTAAADFEPVDLGEDPSETNAALARAGIKAKRTLPMLSAAGFAGKKVPPREWHAAGLIPANTVTLLYGDGGTGKSTLALQCGVATVLGKEWLGVETKQGGCVYLSAEDDTDEIHRRLADVVAFYGASFSDLDAFHILPMAEEGDALLAVQEGNGKSLQPTPLYDAIDRMLDKVRPKLLMLDTLADIFGGNEIDRTHARGFVNLLKKLAAKHRLSCLVLAHPSLSGISSGTGTSGSTGWNNSVRSRLYFKTMKDENAKEDNSDLRVLETAKANYARKGGQISLQWVDGVFVPLANVSASAKASEAHIDSVFLRLLSEFNTRGISVSPNPSASYAPRRFADDPTNPGVAKKGFEDAMARLLGSGRVKVAEKGPPSRRTAYLTCSDGGRTEFTASEIDA